MLITRDFKTSSQLFIDGIATFSCTELCSYDTFIYYTIIICIITLPRTELYTKIINNPQIIAIIRNQPELQIFLNSLYICDYKLFFEKLVYIYKSIQNDQYLYIHIKYIIKEYRILSYIQFLTAYKSVLLQTMAEKFGISLTLLDTELSHFISINRINAKIDKVNGIIVSNRIDNKNLQYLNVIKKGKSNKNT